MADSIDPTANNGNSVNFLPNFYRTDSNKKFLQSTIDQLTQPGEVRKINGFIGRQNAKASTGTDIFLEAADDQRQHYQLEPSLVVKDQLSNTTFFKDYQDYINMIEIFGGNVKNHERLNGQEFYSWDPHICWDKFVNFQNYYWLPYGPDVIRIAGEPKDVISTYKVKVESQKGNNAYVFMPNGLVRNPTIKLFRDMTYIFEINSPGNPFSIKTARTLGGQDRYSSLTIDPHENAVEVGTITFTVPSDAPDLLFYVSENDIDLGGVFEILSIDENSTINVEETIVGKKTYILQNGTALSNGMKVSFIGEVTPEQYANKRFYIEGVGDGIRLIDENSLELISPYTESISILFDTTPFDNLPFSDVSAYPGVVDYITVNRGSRDRNPWSRYNRWFHKDVIEISAKYNGKVPEIDQSARALRPIIEFESDIKLFNFGTRATTDVDIIDTFTKDVFSDIEGSLGYNVDGIQLLPGHRVLFTADTDILVKNKIYRVEFPTIQTSRRELSFIPSVAVDITNDTITLPYRHKLSTKNALVYSSNGNNPITGLTSYQTYYVNVIDDFTFNLYEDNKLFKKIDLISIIDDGKLYSFYLKNIQTSDTVNAPVGFTYQYSAFDSNIYTDIDYISLTEPHHFTSGDKVEFRDPNNTWVEGFEDGRAYYVKVIDDYTIVFYKEYNPGNLNNPFVDKVNIPELADKPAHVFTTFETNRQLHLVEEETPTSMDVVLIRQGKKYQGTMFWFDGSTWNLAQQKTEVNQPPLFDVVDNNRISYGDKNVYNGSTFNGSKIFSYKVGTSTGYDQSQQILGFPLSYKNINNIGDILFNFNLATDIFEYKDQTRIITENINTGYLIKTDIVDSTYYVTGWQKCTSTTVQAAICIYKNSNRVNDFDINIFDDIQFLDDLIIKVFINGIRLDKVDPLDNRNPNWIIVDGPLYKRVILKQDIGLLDVLTIKAYTSQPVNSNGYYEIPINLQNNPLNELIKEFTLGEVIDHGNSIVDNLSNFNGTYPGSSNLRDLGNITQFGTKFVQHSGPLSLSVYHLTSENNNIIRAIETARDDYNKFKKLFVTFAEMLGVDTDIVSQVDLILEKINKDKPNNFPYYFSDMVPYGASVKAEINVVDYRIKYYPLSNVFNLDELSSKAVLVYLNNNQLLFEHDYTFDSQGFVVISAEMQNDDIITIYEYENTNGSFVPPTPTKLGLWPKYDPKVFLDTSLITPKLMIQGHDGSLVQAYGDYRDELIIELEKRIYNNVKVKYDKDIIDILSTIPGYIRKTDYSLEEFNQVLAPNFYKWTALVDRDFTKPLSFDRSNPMTFNYRGHGAPDGRPTPGYWRGIYRWMLDTDRPNLCPWEMLGFSDPPVWWEEVYGPAPYTSDNLILWQDLTDGVIREPGNSPRRDAKYSRPFLIDHIPVDSNGNLISPLTSGLSAGFITVATEGDYIFGDVSPVEAAWRRSSYYPFSVLITSMLLNPAKTFGTLIDRSRIIRNLAGELVYKDTGLRITPKDIKLPSIYSSKIDVQTAGIINYIVDYILSDNLRSYDLYQYNLKNITANLSHRIGAFTSKSKYNLLLDSKSPLSTGSVFVPQEDYDIVLNSSSPIKKIAYSGVIITKLVDGFDIKGYNISRPYFYYYPWTKSGITVNVGGISESYAIWSVDQFYENGKIVEFGGQYFRATVNHTTTDLFNEQNYVKLQSLPVIGGRTATFRSDWDRTDPIVVPYGTKFRTIQEVVDFLLGYGEWLKDEGFIFDTFNKELGVIANWETSAKEFMFWTTQNWSSGEDKWKNWIPNTPVSYGSIVRYNGDYYRAITNVESSAEFNEDDYILLEGLSMIGSSVISLSPAASMLSFISPLSVVDDIRNPFYIYEIFKVDGTPIATSFINSYRDDTSVSYAPTNNDGIYGATFYLVQKEHVIVLNNSTMFNDTIYHPSTGYRQERIKVSGYASDNWDGSLNVPGFIVDQAKVNEWEEWTDYHLGDIVKYKQFYYSANSFLPGTAIFEATNWIKLDTTPTQQLLPNWTYKASQFTDFYSLDSDNFDLSQQKMAQHLIGYQKREYLSNIIKDDVSEYKFYQGMIVEKGTQNVFNKLFDVLSSEGKESLKFYEEWAIRVGQYGASSAFENLEVILDESLFRTNPQGIEFISTPDQRRQDFVIRYMPQEVYLKPLKYNSAPWPILSNNSQYLRTPGYVRPDEVRFILTSLDQVLSQDISQIEKGHYVWCGFEGREWNVYKYVNSNIKVLNATYSDELLTIITSEFVELKAGDIIGITSVTAFDSGFYKISSVSLDTINIEGIISNWDGPFEDQNTIQIFKFVSYRFESIDQLTFKQLPTLSNGDLLWTDNLGDGKSATWEYNTVYNFNEIVNDYPQEGLKYGKNLVINSKSNVAVITDNEGRLYVYTKPTNQDQWIAHQLINEVFISQPGGVLTTPTDVIGEVLAMSPDGRWLVVGTPKASGVSTKYVGAWNQNTNYDLASAPGTGIRVNAEDLVTGYEYVILTTGTTDFRLVGAASNTANTTFVATGPTTGSGIVYYTPRHIVRSGYKFYQALQNYSYTSVDITGTISGTTLSVVMVNSSGTVKIGQVISGIGIQPDTRIISFKTGTGGIGTYEINRSHNISNNTAIVANSLPPALNPIAWNELNYLSVDVAGVNSNRIEEGVISIYEKDSNNTFILVDSIVSPQPVSYEHFGSSLSVDNETIIVGASGRDTGVLYQLNYGTIVKASALYNPVGSVDNIIKLSSIVGIRVGMGIQGDGFVSGQIVKSIDTVNNTVTITAPPDSNPSGILEFTSLGWRYFYKTTETTVTGNYSSNPNVSQVQVASTLDIEVGSLIKGSGFFGGQTVSNIVSPTLIGLDLETNSGPVGSLSFDSLVIYSVPAPTIGNSFGLSLALSKDGSTLVVSNSGDLYIGKVFVYIKQDNKFVLFGNLIEGYDVSFGDSITVSNDGNYIAVVSKLGDNEYIDQGRVTIYKRGVSTYEKYQDIYSQNPEKVGLFGSKISFLNDFNTLVIFSQNADTYTTTSFDGGETTFEDGKTKFSTRNPDSGTIQIYDRYNNFWVYSETLKTTDDMIERYGAAISIGANSILVSAIDAKDQNVKSGKVYEYIKNYNDTSWKIKHREIDKIDIRKIKQAFLYNKTTNKLVTYLDVLDANQGKISGIADQELKFKTFFDPATYSTGTSEVNVDDGMSWNKPYVGTLWWDLRTAKFYDSYSDDLAYRNSSWNTLFPGASIDIYEWVETLLTPDEWNELADTEEGLALGISGLTLYDNTVYSIIRKYDNISKSFRNTYYYWVKNKKTIPNVPGRNMSAADVASLISNPRGNGYKYIELTSTNSLNIANVASLLEDKDVILSIEYWTVKKTDQNIHSQWKLLTNDAISEIPSTIELKWVDSLCGKDLFGRPVPDLDLPIKIRFGIENRPRQSMFINRFEALKQIVEETNRVLIKHQIAEQRDISKLELFDTEPSVISTLYDIVLDTEAELRFSGYGNFSKATLTPIIVDGKIIDVTVKSTGNGYGIINIKDYDTYGIASEWYGPNVIITGSGRGAEIKTTVNSKGQINGIIIVSEGIGYTDDTVLSLRNYSALIHSDSQAIGRWSIYSYEPLTQMWSRVLTQSFDTRKYWNYIDWYDPDTDYNQFTAYKYSVDTLVDLNTIRPGITDLVKVRTSNSGNWILLEKYNESSSIDWTQSYRVVGSQNGTIQFKSTLYQFINTIYGYDGTLYDEDVFDDVAAKELRIIFDALKNDILIDTLKQEYLNIFFTSLRYALKEQTYIDWAFKTSFIKAQHNVGELKQKVTYNNDNLSDFEAYVSEVKPYRTKVREYVSTYSKIDDASLSATDFDLPPIYDEKMVPILASIRDGVIESSSNMIATYPWKHWLDNVGFVVTELRIVNGGSGYLSEPSVKIVGGGGTGAKAKAFIANGKINRIVLLSPGKGFISAPTVIVEGGITSFGTNASIVAIIGNSVIRSNLIKMKFDRITQTYFITQLQETETFVGTGSRMQFPLVWAPDVRIGFSSVTVNGIDVLRDNYKLSISKSVSRGYTSYSGSLILDTAPLVGEIIVVTYLKDWTVLNAADRIQYYYNPESGQLGKDLAQLMTGVDYGGVVVTGLDFNVSGGWDSLPYFADKWDDYENSLEDYILTTEENTHTYSLPASMNIVEGTNINVYHARIEKTEIVSDGATTEYSFDINNVYPPSVTVVVETTLNGNHSAGSKTLSVNRTVGIKVGDVVTIITDIEKALNYGTIVTSINSENNTVELDQILFKAIPPQQGIVFTRKLVDPIDCLINKNGKINLNYQINLGDLIIIESQVRPIRLDDLNFDEEPALITNPNAIMNTWISDGQSLEVNIPNSFTINEGDTLIFRKSTSDGSILPRDDSYDTALKGGDLAYSSATGLSADDIIVDGDGFVTPTSSPATEEVVPGQVVDAVAIRVFDKPSSGAATIRVDNFIADGTNTIFEMTQYPNSNQAVIVKVSNGYTDPVTNEITTLSVVKNIQIEGDSGDYTVDYRNKSVVFHNPPTEGSMVSIFSIGFSGSNILDLGHFVADGIQQQFVTKAPWTTNITDMIYVDGQPVTALLFDTGVSNRIGIRFIDPPVAGALISYIIVRGSEQSFAVTKVERFITNPSTITYNLKNKVGDEVPNESNMIVRIDQTILKGPNNVYFDIKNNKLNYSIDKVKIPPYSVSFDDISVIANGIVLNPVTDYSIDLSGITIKLTKSAYKKYSGSTLILSIKQSSGYLYIPGTAPKITLDRLYEGSHIVEVISSYKHDILGIQRTVASVKTEIEYTPDTIEYYDYLSVLSGQLKIDRAVINDSYLWVIKNGNLLIPSVDYKLNSDRESITLSHVVNEYDEFSVITFGNNVLTHGVSYMQFKDMLNRTHFKRLNLKKQTKLARDLLINDITIEVEDATNFDTPNPLTNKPGIIEVRGERIEYFTMDGNILGQLRRGTLGTGTPKIHRKGSYVQDIGPSETIPYVDTTEVIQIVSDGTNIIPLTFAPQKTNTDWTYTDNSFVSSIPESYGQTDEIEVFVGGYDISEQWNPNRLYVEDEIVIIGSYTYRCITSHTSSLAFNLDKNKWAFFIGNIRLKKKPYVVHNVNKHPESTEGDIQFDADFAVDGDSLQIRLTNKLSIGTRVTVIKRNGKTWDSTVSIQNDESKIGNFIRSVPGIWYVDYIKYDAEQITSLDTTHVTYDDIDEKFD